MEKSPMNDWPFDELKNVAAMSMTQVIRDGQPILFVSHDAEDGMWQFLSGGTVCMADAMIVGLGEVYELDSSIGELADLPLGWTAERSSPGQCWQRKQ